MIASGTTTPPKRASVAGPRPQDEPNAKYRDAHVWYDAEHKDEFGAYKLLIADVINGRSKVVPHAVMSAGGIMDGARGGVDLPEKDVPRVKSHLAKYYKKMGDTAPWARASPRTRPATAG